ncbi:MAG: hypothetical protein AAF705_09320, partial [Bacteroidota bacterium]
ESQSVDKMVQEDEELSKEFQRRQTAHLSLDYMLARDLKAQLQGLEEKSKIVSIKKNRTRRMFIYSIAASVLFLIGAFYFILPGDSMSSSELALSNYESPDFSIRGNDSQISDQEALNSGISAYESGNFEQSVQNFEGIPVDNPYYILGRYYLGHSFFAQEAYAQAAENFRLVKEANDLRYTEEAEWYELLSCLASEGSCMALIDGIITNENHAYYTQATKISKKLK